jgi:plastocyanin
MGSGWKWLLWIPIAGALVACRVPVEDELSVHQQPPPHSDLPREFETPGFAVPESGHVDMVVEGYRYGPNVLLARPGQRIHVSLTNRSVKQHSIAFELPTGDVRLDRDLAEGESADLEVFAPREEGEYEFYCPVGSHRVQGMKGVLLVSQDHRIPQGVHRSPAGGHPAPPGSRSGPG